MRLIFLLHSIAVEPNLQHCMETDDDYRRCKKGVENERATLGAKSRQAILEDRFQTKAYPYVTRKEVSGMIIPTGWH
jgi:hypothetical protein